MIVQYLRVSVEGGPYFPFTERKAGKPVVLLLVLKVGLTFVKRNEHLVLVLQFWCSFVFVFIFCCSAKLERESESKRERVRERERELASKCLLPLDRRVLQKSNLGRLVS